MRLVGDDTALVFGDARTLAIIGTKIDALPDAVAQGVAVGNLALQGVTAAGQVSGQLVRLTAESAAALKALGPVVDSSGAILGVVKNGSDQFAKVLRFESASALSTAASLGPALTSLALQMQLQAITKQLKAVKRLVEGIAQHQEDTLVVSVESNVRALDRIYRKLLETGTVSQPDAAELTTRRKSLEDDVALIGKKIDKATAAISGVRGQGSDRWAGDRLASLDDSTSTTSLCCGSTCTCAHKAPS